MKHLHNSIDEAYGRPVSISVGTQMCDYCKEEKTILEVDTSLGEYLSFNCCLDCFTAFIKSAEVLK